MLQCVLGPGLWSLSYCPILWAPDRPTNPHETVEARPTSFLRFIFGHRSLNITPIMCSYKVYRINMWMRGPCSFNFVHLMSQTLQWQLRRRCREKWTEAVCWDECSLSQQKVRSYNDEWHSSGVRSVDVISGRRDRAVGSLVAPNLRRTYLENPRDEARSWGITSPQSLVLPNHLHLKQSRRFALRWSRSESLRENFKGSQFECRFHCNEPIVTVMKCMPVL